MRKDKIKVRKSTKYFCIIIISIIFAISFSVIFNYFVGERKYVTNEKIYEYKNVFSHEYKVNLKDNKYIPDKSLSMDKNAYVTDLIDNIDLDFVYKYNADKVSDINYTYQIKGIINGIYTKDSKEQEIIEREYILKEPNTVTVNTDNININEKLILDLEDKNILINDFEKEIGISVDTRFNVIFEVKMDTIVEGEKVEIKKDHIVSIGLADKVTFIETQETKDEVESVYKKVEHEKEKSLIALIINIVLVIISIYSYVFVFTRFQTVNKIKNEFRTELNRIIKLCKEKLVQVDNLNDSSSQNIIFVKDFEEIYRISEEVFKPILYWISPKNNEAYFTVISDEMTYRYILKRK